MRRLVLAAAAAAIGSMAFTGAADASKRPKYKAKSVVLVDAGGIHPKSPYYHRAPQVRGFLARRGGYSYSYTDTINTYGLSRSNFSGVNVYRDTTVDRQTNAGPFDHGFFFDSGMGPRGGNSPYPN